MELPASTFHPEIRRSLESLSPLDSYIWCGTPRRERIGTSSRLHLPVWKLPRGISAYANSPHCISEVVDFEPRGFGKKGRIHFVGVGGSGLSALAMLALKQGYMVSGSDIAWSSYMDALKEAGASLFVGHSERNLHWNGEISSFPQAVVVSSAIPPENVEVLIAKSRGVPMYKRGAWLGKITKDYNLIAVSGSHGKSTTASMLAYVLKAMGDDLTAVIGAQVPQADEYDGCFLGLLPHIAIVTNLDWEHVDIYQDEEAVEEIFRKFLERVRTDGHLIVYGDKHGQSLGAFSMLNHPMEESDAPNYVKSLSDQLCANRYNITTFGMSSYNNWQASSVSPNSLGGCDYQLCHNGHPVTEISLQIPGDHNVLNSLAVIAALNALFGDGRQLYESIDKVKSHLKNFKGISRRFEYIGKIHGCRIFDDYAHHPTEVRCVLQAARRLFPSEELLVVFQPHTYSRLAALMSEFASAFREADQVIVTEVYAARETNVWKIGGENLAMFVTSPTCDFIPCLENVISELVNMVSENRHRQLVILTLGAGDITLVGRKVLRELEQKFNQESSLQFL
ncbi:UDP-N-acetylmuramate--L-alanine ligase-like isoform X2 [Salvia hispanica]|uniref:UDP-N-acetylmuramate--L-alanine ligase-like isoform X2 n=1 Tax=Salvia hispanica TaxID=49212 RepID=UPI0020095DC2|nr:UDP-N-acetylmuramate--L-alanine ligase-like isoform X2 [Salvia hispanica]